jgi:3-oxoacyl-ACP reductase-like protein
MSSFVKQSVPAVSAQPQTQVQAPVAAVAPASAPVASTAAAAPAQNFRYPDLITFQNATKIAISEDKPIMMDYWSSSIDKTAIIGVRDNKEKLLVKSTEEYTSPIQKIFKTGTNDYIIMTENSIYLVDTGIPTRRIM